ncbi:MAG: 4Fe-4S dicluster domain-containing protein [Chloroflexi bacterium]|nr:4Fe-4S dicluster domain-containing protein [Chloroflexota bacterium]
MMMKTRKVYPRPEYCMACHLCEVHCVAAHSKSRDLVKAFKRESPKPMPRLHVEESGPMSFALGCRHCDEPLCVYSCLTGALSKDAKTGIVSVDSEKCIGCWTCVIACPYGAIAPDPARKKANKCDLCFHLEKPACVANCPNEALVWGEVNA